MSLNRYATLVCLLGCAWYAQGKTPYGIVIHGGAGNILKSKMSPEKEKAYREGLEAALQAGYAVLEKGGTSLDAVEATIRLMEDDPLFNAGRGAVLTFDGKVELDASIMDGSTLAAGSVAGVRTVKNPLSLARLVMEKSPHVMLVGEGAEQFAREKGIPAIENSSLITPECLKAWKTAKEKYEKTNPKGTVGAAALDQHGNLAAATSTGGMMLKRWGRVGDSPMIGIGTYANNATCAISCTGWGEYFIRSVVAFDVSAQMTYSGASLEKAASLTLDKVKKLGGDGGLVGIDAKGNVTMSFNTDGMLRAYQKSDGSKAVEMYGIE